MTCEETEMSDSKVTTLDDGEDKADINSGSTPAVEKAAKTASTKGLNKTVAAKEAGIGNDRKTITVHAGEGSAGREDVPVFVNGYGFNIKRGKPVEVPVEVIEVLKNAVTTQYENGEAIEVPRFAFTVHG
jgi:hypothetical protein